MARPLREILIDFIGALREAGVRISVAESLDAMQAVTVAGLRPARMREALRASLIKDEADSPGFDQVFAEYFVSPTSRGLSRQSRGAQIGLSGTGRGDSSGMNPVPPAATPRGASARQVSTVNAPSTIAQARSEARRQAGDLKRAGGSQAAELIGKAAKRDSSAGRESSVMPGERGTGAHDSIETAPFADYTPLEYGEARQTLQLLQRRLRVRLGRRMRRAKAGRIDLRRTLRASIQRGGALIDLQMRARRPKHIDLVALADISGSVHFAASLMLELLAGATDCFRRARSFVYVDRIASADFERGHLVMTPNLDLYARSDFGRVLGELTRDHLRRFNSSTVLVILGDGRNNRRPARADLLRDLSRRCRMTLWLNPEPIERWGTGDSAIETYRKVIDYLIPCRTLEELARGLSFIG
ncbi:MAG TPA: VWA domain-containing protein [Candidatus Binataceae bacterium]|nr:VWA domain-containing protein [Candidatus Binataceae bacterium]